MKTLDEVIEAQERCATYPDCHFCYLHAGPICEWIRDALNYLKEYRSDKAMWEADRKGFLDWIEQYKESREKHQQAVIELKKNPPLSWEELRTMEGKPVWVEEYDPIDEKTGWHTASWKLIEFISDEYFEVRDSDGEQRCFYMSENDWQAYRKERE